MSIIFKLLYALTENLIDILIAVFCKYLQINLHQILNI